MWYGFYTSVIVDHDDARHPKNEYGKRTMLLRFFRSEPAAAIVLLAMASLAILIANTPLYSVYEDALGTYLLGMSVHHWINDALMAIFFLMVGLEIKREIVVGALASWQARLLPGMAAIGGMAVPALLFVLVNRQDSDHLAGWAIPSATDIAFALGVLALLGSRVPAAVRVLLVGIAIIDDLLAILVIAVFYSDGLSATWLVTALLLSLTLVVMNRFSVHALLPYLAVGVVLWYAVYQSGLHATLAGVIVAMTIPLHGKSAESKSPLNTLEHSIILWVNFGIVPLFGFANAGISFANLSGDVFLGTLPVGIAAGLFIGKQIGIFGTIWMLVRLGLARMPARTSWRQLHAMAALCGIGFTMSLFIGGLAFQTSPHLLDATKIGVIGGSVISATVGAVLMLRATTPDRQPEDQPASLHHSVRAEPSG